MLPNIRANLTATLFAATWAACMVPTAGQALEIVFDYQHDTFVFGNPTAKAALEAAAADVSAAVTSQLNAIPADTFVGISGNMQLTINWNFLYTNPEDGTNEVVSLARANADEVTLFVGGRSIAGNSLGAGGPAIIRPATGSPSAINPSPLELAGALAIAESDSEAAYLRGGAGPVVGTHTNTLSVGTTEATYNVDFGVAVGHLWFDSDSSTNWHYDHTSSTVPSGKSDFYTVALHEILHTLGLGSSATWTSMVAGIDWTGSEVAALVGNGSSLINGSGDHIAAGVASTRIDNGVSQFALMTSNIAPGTRKKLTALDLALLRDIGWETITSAAPSSDGDYNGNGVVDAADYAVWLDSLGNSVAAGSGADGSSNGIIDQADYQFWKTRLGNTTGTGIASVTPIPEPSTAILILAAWVALSVHARTGRGNA